LRFMQGHSINQGSLNVIKFQTLGSVDVLGEGNFGVTYRCFWTDGKKWVCVKVPKHKAGHDEWAEISVFVSVPPHPNVLPLLGICSDFKSKHKNVNTNNACCFVTEFVDGGSLKQNLTDDHQYERMFGKKEEMPRVIARIVRVLWDVAEGVNHLHNNSIVHRDLAARNMLVAGDGHVLVSDFGLSRHLQEDDSTPNGPAAYYRVASPTMVPVRWLAPESMEDMIFTRASDVFSFGVLAWETLTRSAKVPYHEVDSVNKILIGVSTGRLRLTLPDFVPPDLATIINDCWKLDAKDRPTMAEIVTRLKALDAVHAQFLRDKPIV